MFGPFKRLFAVLCAVSLVISFVPASAYAEGLKQKAEADPTESIADASVEGEADDDADSGAISKTNQMPDQAQGSAKASTEDTSAGADVEMGVEAQQADGAEALADDLATLNGRQVENINSSWTFSTGDTTTEGWGFPDGRGSGTVDLPHSWEYVHPTRSYIPAFNKKTVTYAKNVDVSAYQSGHLYVKSYGASKNAELLVDGVSVGTHVGGYSAFAFDISDQVAGKTSVELTFKVTNVDTDSIPINVDYTQWAGLYRDVELVSVPNQFISLDDSGSNGLYVDYGILGTNANVTARVKLNNKSENASSNTLRVTVLDADGGLAASCEVAGSLAAEAINQEVSAQLSVPSVHLWNGTSDPYLYQVKAELLDANGNVLDSVVQKTGFRTFAISGGTAYLNGKEIKIHGVGYHQDRKDMGTAVSSAQIKSDVDTMLEMGVNFVRASHYPHDRAFYEYADEVGLLVYNEIPYYLLYSKAASYSNSVKDQLVEMIRQGYNYPCVVMLGVQNEVGWSSSYASYGPDFNVTQDELIAFNKELVALAQSEDASRMVVQATIDGSSQAQVTKRWSSDVDLTGVNLYVGFKSALSSGGDAGRTQLSNQLNKKLDSYKNIYGTGNIMISEYGAGANVDHHIEVDDNFSWDGDSNSSTSMHYEEYQSYLHEIYWSVITGRDDVPVSSVWNMFDFSCYRNEGGTTRLNTKGLVGYDHTTKKDAFYFYKANWNTSEKFVHITSKRFTERNKQQQEIKVYSNCESVELFVNGVSLGQGVKQESGVFVWKDVALSSEQENSLRAVGTSGGATYEDAADGITVPAATVTYRAHVANIGWQDPVTNGSTAGTTGQSKSMEALETSLSGVEGSVEMKAHVANLGWQNWTTGASGTTGQSKQIEAIRLQLTGKASEEYDIWYRAHSAEYGWLGWAANGNAAGSTGKGRGIQAIQILVVKKGAGAPGTTANAFYGTDSLVSYRAHVANIGWQSYVSDGATAGTTGQSRNLEALDVQVDSLPNAVEVRAHVSNVGWQDWTTSAAGTTGQGKAIEAVQMRLSGSFADRYDVYYRVHSANFGWLDWAKNGESAGSVGYGRAAQAVQVVLVEKGGDAPGATGHAFCQPLISYQAHVANIGWQSYSYDGETAGTVGQSKAVEALKLQLRETGYEGDIEYRAHVANIGWQEWVTNSSLAGTTGRGLQVEAIAVKLTGEAAEHFTVRYRAHVKDRGWLDWVEDGDTAGTTGQGLRVEALQVELIAKNA